VVLPGSFAAAEHASAHYNGAVGAKVLRHQLVVQAGLAAGEAMGLAPALEPKGPLVQLVAAFAERLLERGVRSGDVAIERQRDLGDDFAHFRSLRGELGGRRSAVSRLGLARRLAKERSAEHGGQGRERRADEEGEVVPAGERAELAGATNPEAVRPRGGDAGEDRETERAA